MQINFFKILIVTITNNFHIKSAISKDGNFCKKKKLQEIWHKAED